MFRLNSTAFRKKYKKVLYYFRKRSLSSQVELPSEASVVIIGGGVTGCSLLYQLSKRGIKAVLLERGKVTCGTTWHTGALIWSLRPNDIDIQLLQKTRDIQVSLEKETGMNTGWINSGGIFIARTKERLEEYKRLHSLGHHFNIESHLISPTEAAKLSPILEPKSFMGALYTPADGYTDPSMYCSALVKGSTARGGHVFENCGVTNILVDSSSTNKKITGVETISGVIKTSCIVNAAGAWGPSIAKMVSVQIPVIPIKHAYILTDSIPEVKGTPSLRDHDGCLYFRTSGESMMLGGYENNPVLINYLPDDFQFSLYDLDMSVFGVNWERACEICPSFEKIGIKSTICGPESFTPDHKPIIGEDPRILGLFHACGFNSLGIMLSAGCAEQLAIWIDQGTPDLSMHNFDIKRFTNMQKTDKTWYTESAHEGYIQTYSIVFPNDQPLAGRNHRISPFHEALVASGAVMETAQGYERPSYFIKDRTAPVRGYDWYGTNDHLENVDKRYVKEIEGFHTFDFWKQHELIKEECLATRNNLALFDISSCTKMYLTGVEASLAADWLFTANMDKDPGKVIYTCTLTSKGGIAADLTVVPLEEGGGTLVGPILKGKGYYIVAGEASGHHTLCHLERELTRRKFKAVITNVTEKLGILSLSGPKSGELLQSITETPITNEKFPFGMSQIVKINGHICRVIRISYTGELGYELHIPTGSCIAIYNKIIETGRGFDLKLAGTRALDSLSCEKGYHLTNVDIRIDDNPVEASLIKVCRKNGDYLGKKFVEKAKTEGVSKKRVFFILNEKMAIYGLETIWRDDTPVGFLRRGNYGFSLDCSIGIGYVEAPQGQNITEAYLKSGNYQIEIRSKKYPATLYLQSPFDPNSQRVLGNYENKLEEHTQSED